MTKKRSELGIDRPYAEPETAMEKDIAGIVCEFLRLDQVGRDDPFFDLGIDSFSALQISLAAEQRFGLALDTNWMGDEATLRSLAARVKPR